MVSQFGHMFAPRLEVAIKEMLRALKPGGTIAFSTWPPELITGRSFALMGKYAPPPPPGVSLPVQWGDPTVVRERLGTAVKDITFNRDAMLFQTLSVPHYRTFMEQSFVPAKKLFQALDASDPAKAAALRREIEELGAHPPKGIGGFTFDMTQLQAEQACAANRQAWHVDGSVALCSPNVESNDARPVRLDFQSGELHRMTVIRRASSGELAKTYDELYATLRTTYGPPQVERAALVGPCSGALAECMKNGEKPKGPTWN